MFSEEQLKHLRWQHYQRVPNQVLPVVWRSWVLDRGSLTQRLIERSKGHFRVAVLDQHLGFPLLNERQALNVPERTTCIIREVALMCFDTPWVYARSIVPVTTLTGSERRLADLGSRPLGAFLFRSPQMSRGPLQLARFNGLESHDDSQDAKAGWGRRSVFRLHGKPLLVTEFFTPRVLAAELRSSPCH